MSGSSPCSSCTKRCCMDYTVSVTGYDAWLISTALQLPLESFLVVFPVSEPNDRGFLLEPGGQQYEIALSKVGRFQKGNPCVFWMDLKDGRGRCGIYPVRPFVCQTYPAHQQQGTVLLRDDALCPTGSWNLAGMDLPLFRQRLCRLRMEQDIYAYVVAGWNRDVEQGGRPRRTDEYYAYLVNAYGQIARFRQRLPREVLARVVERWGERDASAPNPLFADLTPPGAPGHWSPVVAGIRASVDGFAATLAEARIPVAIAG